MKNYNLYPFLRTIKENLQTINRGKDDYLNYIDNTNHQWQRVLETGNILTLDLLTGELQATADISLSKIHQLLGLQDKKIIFEEYKSLFSPQQYQNLLKYQYISVPQYDTYLEGLTQIIFGQQLAVSVANQHRRTFIQKMGTKYHDNLYQYPKLENIQEEFINQLTISNNKKKSLLEIKEYFLKNPLQKLDIKELSSQLINLFGIGQWSVDWFFLRCTQQLHIIPSSDLKVKKTFTTFFNKEEYMDSKKLKELEKIFYPIGGLLTHCLLMESKNLEL